MTPRILFVDFTGLGSTCLAIPVLAALERAVPSVRYSYPHHPLLAAAGLITHAGLDGLIATTPAHWRQFAEADWSAIAAFIDEHRIDTVVNFRNPDLLVDDRYPRFLQWYRAESGRLGHVDLYQELELEQVHVQDRMIRLLQAAGWPVADVADDWLAGWPASKGAGAPNVGLFASASMAAKRWPQEHWMELGRLLLERRPEAGLTLFAGNTPVERDVAHDLWGALSRIGGGRVSFVEPGGFADLATRLSALSLLVANDTGVGHFAAALGVPTVSLHLSTRRVVWAPRGTSALALQSLIGERCVGQRPAQGNCVRHYEGCVAPCHWDVRPDAVSRAAR